MLHGMQTTLHGLASPENLGSMGEDISGLSLSGLDTIHLVQPAPHIPSLEDVDEFDYGSSKHKQAPRKIYEPESVSYDRVDRFSQSFFATVDALVDIIVDNQDLLTSLNNSERLRLNEVRDKLSTIVGKDENYFLVLLIEVIERLIGNQEKEDMNVAVNPDYESADVKWNAPRHVRAQALDEAYSYDEPEVLTEDMNVAVNPDYESADVKWNAPRHVRAQALDEAYSYDEPEVLTEDMNVAVNPDYESADVKWNAPRHVRAQALDEAYSYDEPEVLTEDMNVAVNPDYESADVKWNAPRHVRAQALDEAYSYDEPEQITGALN